MCCRRQASNHTNTDIRSLLSSKPGPLILAKCRKFGRLAAASRGFVFITSWYEMSFQERPHPHRVPRSPRKPPMVSRRPQSPCFVKFRRFRCRSERPGRQQGPQVILSVFVQFKAWMRHPGRPGLQSDFGHENHLSINQGCDRHRPQERSTPNA